MSVPHNWQLRVIIVFFPLGEFSSCKLNQIQPSSKFSVAGDLSQISSANINERLVIILLLATGNVLSYKLFSSGNSAEV